MKPAPFALGCLLLFLAGCTSPKPAETASAATALPAAPYNTDVEIAEVMEHVMNPAGYQFWSGWGGVEDEHGYHDLTPKTDEEWKKVEDGAATIVVATNAIMVPGYARAPQADWYGEALKVQKIALEGKAAAERHDKDALGDIGERLDAACDGCHAKFAIPPQK
jgi:hypothetical protein